MPKHSEKKYLVDDFSNIMSQLDELGAKKAGNSSSTHYYAKLPGNDVTKLVHYSVKDEIHILKESNGTFALTDTIAVKNVDDGIRWLRGKGFETIEVVKMDYDDYEYNDGIIGLYVINDFLHSVILDFPKDQHSEIEKLFGLNSAGVIKIPYNKYLESIGQAKIFAEK